MAQELSKKLSSVATCARLFVEAIVLHVLGLAMFALRGNEQVKCADWDTIHASHCTTWRDAAPDLPAGAQRDGEVRRWTARRGAGVTKTKNINTRKSFLARKKIIHFRTDPSQARQKPSEEIFRNPGTTLIFALLFAQTKSSFKTIQKTNFNCKYRIMLKNALKKNYFEEKTRSMLKKMVPSKHDMITIKRRLKICKKNVSINRKKQTTCLF